MLLPAILSLAFSACNDSGVNREEDTLVLLLEASTDSNQSCLHAFREVNWDQLLIIAPYTRCAQIPGLSEADRQELSRTGIRTYDDFTVLAFLHKKKLMHRECIARSRVDFCPVVNKKTGYIFLRKENTCFFLRPTHETTPLSKGGLEAEHLPLSARK